MIPQSAFATKPASAMIDKYPQRADSAASALSAALAVTTDSLRFCRASKGMPMAATINTEIPMMLDLGSRWPSRANVAMSATLAANTNRRPAVIRAAERSEGL